MDSLAVAIRDCLLDERLCRGQLREVRLRSAVNRVVVYIAFGANVVRSQSDHTIQAVLLKQKALAFKAIIFSIGQ